MKSKYEAYHTTGNCSDAIIIGTIKPPNNKDKNITLTPIILIVDERFNTDAIIVPNDPAIQIFKNKTKSNIHQLVWLYIFNVCSITNFSGVIMDDMIDKKKAITAIHE